MNTVNRYQKIFSIVGIVAIIGAGFLVWNQGRGQSAKSIQVYSGAGLKKTMDEIGQEFEKETGIQVNYNYAGSNTLLSQIELIQEGEAYMPGATYYIDQADKKGFIGEKHFVVYHTPVIIVPEGNPENISSLKDLTDSNVDVVLGDSGACAIGKLGNKILKQNGILEGVEDNVVTRTGTTNELVVYISQNQAEAGICWHADVHNLKNKTDIVKIAEENNIIKKVPIGTLKFSNKKEVARKFVEFVSSERGKNIFKKYGFIKYED